jgi:hypothetical protein
MADKAPKKFEVPVNDAGEITLAEDLTLESISETRDAAKAYLKEVDIANAEELDAATLEHIEQVLSYVDALDARDGEITAEQEALDARLTAARDRAAALNKTAEESAEGEGGEGEGEGDGEGESVEGEPAEQEAVLASGRRRPTVARAARKAPEVILPKDEKAGRKTVVLAAANVPDFNQNQEIDSLDTLADAFLSLTGAFGARGVDHFGRGAAKTTHRELTKNAARKGVARIKRDENQFSVDRDMSAAEQMQIILDASDEVKRFGSFGGLTAAGGWCAPSETIYDLFSYHTGAGTFDIAEVTARRGGISFTKGPDFMTIFADPDAGWSMTEAQAEAGTFTKPCFALECPPFEEVRLDAIGFCATAPLLTEAGYPELVRMVLSMLAAGHERRKSAATIARISTMIGAATVFAPVGAAGSQSGYADTLAALELDANRIRQTLAMDPNATVEAVFPYWAYGVFRTELSRRLGLDNPFRITNSDIDSHFALRGIRAQFVYDYQMLSTGAAGTAGGTAAWTAWPTTLEYMIWPAGAFTRLVNDVINLDAVYDHDLLTQNEYTAAFMEEGFAVANTRGFGLKRTVALNPEGSSGFPAIGAGADVTFATV